MIEGYCATEILVWTFFSQVSQSPVKLISETTINKVGEQQSHLATILPFFGIADQCVRNSLHSQHRQDEMTERNGILYGVTIGEHNSKLPEPFKPK